MNEEVAARIVKYMLHDPIGNVEGEVAEYDPDKLQAAEEQGAVFIAVYDDGDRKIVKAADVKPPEPMLSGVRLVTTVYVDERMKAVCDVFDALGESSLLAMNAAAATVVSAGEASKVQKTFEEALADLKALVYEEAEDADA